MKENVAGSVAVVGQKYIYHLWAGKKGAKYDGLQEGGTWWYHFTFAGRHVQKSAKTSSKTIAKAAELKHRRQLEEGFNRLDGDPRKDRIRSIAEMADTYQEKYQRDHPESASFPKYTSPPIVRLLGNKMLCDENAEVVEEYMSTRLQEGYARPRPSTAKLNCCCASSALLAVIWCALS